MRCGPHTLVFDAGTGLRYLGNSLEESEGLDLNLFLTHTHHDHIVGLPFFSPLFKKKNRLRLWAGHLRPAHGLFDVLCQFMNAPLFPVPPQVFAANLTFHDFRAGETLTPHPEVSLRTVPLNHPNGATGYRVDYDGRSICYVTDTEHEPGAPDPNILGLIEDADIVIYDSTYTDEEFSRYRTWGHSTWQEGARLCDRAKAKQLVIFHHDPGHDDAFMDKIAEAAEKARPGTLVAYEGLVLRP